MLAALEEVDPGGRAALRPAPPADPGHRAERRRRGGGPDPGVGARRPRQGSGGARSVGDRGAVPERALPGALRGRAPRGAARRGPRRRARRSRVDPLGPGGLRRGAHRPRRAGDRGSRPWWKSCAPAASPWRSARPPTSASAWSRTSPATRSTGSTAAVWRCRSIPTIRPSSTRTSPASTCACTETFGYTPAELAGFALAGLRHAFLPEDERTEMEQRFRRQLDDLGGELLEMPMELPVS